MPDAIRTRCKFRVVGVENTDNRIYEKVYSDVPYYTEIEGHEYPDTNGRKYKMAPSSLFAQNIRLAASYDPSNVEDVSFAAATPSGEMKFYCDNPRVVDTFVSGRNYYLDLIPCE